MKVLLEFIMPGYLRLIHSFLWTPAGRTCGYIHYVFTSSHLSWLSLRNLYQVSKHIPGPSPCACTINGKWDPFTNFLGPELIDLDNLTRANFRLYCLTKILTPVVAGCMGVTIPCSRPVFFLSPMNYYSWISINRLTSLSLMETPSPPLKFFFLSMGREGGLVH